MLSKCKKFQESPYILYRNFRQFSTLKAAVDTYTMQNLTTQTPFPKQKPYTPISRFAQHYNHVRAALIGEQNALHPFQQNVLNHVLPLMNCEMVNIDHDSIGSQFFDKQHCFVVQPTGSGKSLCYQLPIILHAFIATQLASKNSVAAQGSLGIVISPTISLLEDQVRQLEPICSNLGVKVSCYHSCLLEKDKESVIHSIESKYLNILYATPESLTILLEQVILPKFGALAKNRYNRMITKNKNKNKDKDAVAAVSEDKVDDYLNISYIVFDEAHTIAESSVIFRPEYAYKCLSLIQQIQSVHMPFELVKKELKTIANAELQTHVQETEAIDEYLETDLGLLSIKPHEPTIMALTASCTVNDRTLILDRLGIPENEKSVSFVSDSWDRPNLSYTKLDTRYNGSPWIYTTRNDSNPRDWIKKNILENKKFCIPAIIYVQTRTEAEMVFGICYNLCKQQNQNQNQNNINNFSYTVGCYHGRTDRHDRESVQSRFFNNKIDILIATNAFGLGVNKHDINTIVHLGIPLNMQRFYQETGRASRLDPNACDGSIISIKHCLTFYQQSCFQVNDRLLMVPLLSCHYDYNKSKGILNDDYLLRLLNKMIQTFYQFLQFIVWHKRKLSKDSSTSMSKGVNDSGSIHVTKSSEFNQFSSVNTFSLPEIREYVRCYGSLAFGNAKWQHVDGVDVFVYNNGFVSGQEGYLVSILLETEYLIREEYDAYEVYFPENFQQERKEKYINVVFEMTKQNVGSLETNAMDIDESDVGDNIQDIDERENEDTGGIDAEFTMVDQIEWFMTNFVVKYRDNAWHTILADDIQAAWDKHVTKMRNINESENNKISSNHDCEEDTLTIESIENLFLFLQSLNENFEFYKDSLQRGYQIADIKTKNVEIDENKLIEWDQDIIRNRKYWHIWKNIFEKLALTQNENEYNQTLKTEFHQYFTCKHDFVNPIQRSVTPSLPLL